MTTRRQFTHTAKKITPVAQVLRKLTATLSSDTATVGGAVPTITVQGWQDLGATIPFTARPLALTYAANTPETATINAEGALTLVAAGTDTFTVEDTISGLQVTTGTLTVSTAGAPPTIGAQGQGIMGANSAAIPIAGAWDAARLYTGAGYASRDAQWRATNFGQANLVANPEVIFSDSSKNGGVSPASSAIYKPGSMQYIDLVTLVDSGINSVPAFRFKWAPVLGNSPGSAQFGLTIPNTRRVWAGRRITHLLGSQTTDGQNWDITGSECVQSANLTYNSTGGGSGAGFKHGIFLAISGFVSSRAGVGGVANGSFAGGHMSGQFTLDGYAAGANGLVGFVDAGNAISSTIDSAFWDGSTYDEVILEELFSDGTHDWIAIRYWRRRVNLDYSVGAWVRVNAYITGRMSDGTNYYDGRYFNSVQFTSKNHNRAIEVPRYRECEEWGAFDADAANCSDPWGCLAADNVHAPKTPWKNTLASQTSSSATFNVVRNQNTYPYDGATPSYVAKLRAVVDGVDQPSANDFIIPAWYADEDPNTAGHDVIPVTLTLATGVHTVAFKGVNAAGTLVSAASPSVNVTI